MQNVITKVDEDSVADRSTIDTCCQQFKSDDLSLQGRINIGRPLHVTNWGNIDKVKTVAVRDGPLELRKIAQNVSVSVTSIWWSSIFILGLSHRSASGVPNYSYSNNGNSSARKLVKSRPSAYGRGNFFSTKLWLERKPTFISMTGTQRNVHRNTFRSFTSQF